MTKFNCTFNGEYSCSTKARSAVGVMGVFCGINHTSLVSALHGPSMFAVKAKIYGVLYKQSSCIAFD